MVPVNNYLKKIMYYDDFSVLAIGSGPEILLVRRNDGRIL